MDWNEELEILISYARRLDMLRYAPDIANNFIERGWLELSTAAEEKYRITIHGLSVVVGLKKSLKNIDPIILDNPLNILFPDQDDIIPRENDFRETLQRYARTEEGEKNLLEIWHRGVIGLWTLAQALQVDESVARIRATHYKHQIESED